MSSYRQQEQKEEPEKKELDSLQTFLIKAIVIYVLSRFAGTDSTNQNFILNSGNSEKKIYRFLSINNL